MWSQQMPVTIREARREGGAYEEVYKTQLQFIMSRVQEHQHVRTKKGLVPLKGCPQFPMQNEVQAWLPQAHQRAV